MADEKYISVKPVDLPHLVRVCEELTNGSMPRPELTKEFYEFFNPSTVLALLRRLRETEERVKELECRS